MRRRDFITNGSLIAAGVSILSASCNENKTTENPAESATGASSDNFELNEKTIDDVLELMSSGKLTGEQISSL